MFLGPLLESFLQTKYYLFEFLPCAVTFGVNKEQSRCSVMSWFCFTGVLSRNVEQDLQLCCLFRFKSLRCLGWSCITTFIWDACYWWTCNFESNFSRHHVSYCKRRCFCVVVLLFTANVFGVLLHWKYNSEFSILIPLQSWQSTCNGHAFNASAMQATVC